MEGQNKVVSFVLIVASFMLISARVWADESPCEQIQDACGEAGFTRDVPGGRDLMTRCFNPILQGQQISGVKVDADQVKKCKDSQNKKSPGKRHQADL